MNSKERMFATLMGEEVDRIPFDLGSCRVTSITKDAYINLAEALHVPINEAEIKLFDAMQQLPELDERIVKLLRIDVRGVQANTVRKSPDIKETETHWTYIDEFGCKWKMPKRGGLYFDLAESPLAGDIDEHTIEEFEWPDPTEEKLFKGLPERAKALSEAHYAVIMEGIGGGIIETASRVRGYKDIYLDFAARPTLVKALLERVTTLKAKLWETAAEKLGEYVHIAREGDDIAGQENLLISPRSYRELLKPCHERLFRTIKEAFPEPIFVFFHSDGAIREVIPDFIETGIDILNPIQPGVPGMNLEEVAKEYGDRVTLWGGAIDPQKVFPTTSPEYVRQEVRERVSRISRITSRYVFATVHNIQVDIPPENIIAMIQGFCEAQGDEFEISN